MTPMRARTRMILKTAALAAAIGIVAVAWLALIRGPEPAAAQGVAARKPESACSVAISQTLTSSPAYDCRPAQVTVTVGLTCPTELPMRLVFVMARHLLMEDHLDEAKAAARDIVGFMPWGVAGTEAGVVSASIQERVEQDMTTRRSAVESAINGIRLDRVDPTMRYFDWLGKAQSMLEEARRRNSVPAIEAIVLVSTGCPTGFDDYCNRQVGAANKAKSADINVIGLCNPDARPFGLIRIPGDHCKYIQRIATSGLYHDLKQHRRVDKDLRDLEKVVTALQPGTVVLKEALAPGLTVVPGSMYPEARLRDGAYSMEWSDVARGESITVTYSVSAGVAVDTPLRQADGSSVELTDSMGRYRSVALPDGEVSFEECPAAPTPTPTPSATPLPSATPTSTPTPTDEPVPSATPTPVPAPIYMPVALRGACRTEQARDAIVLAIDTSSSMGEPSGSSAPGTPPAATKLEAAKTAAQGFIDVLEAGGGRHRVALVTFNATAALASPLEASVPELRAAIGAMEIGAGTRIDRALGTSMDVLAAADDGERKTVVLLTDGRPDVGTEESALEAASSLRLEAGAELYVVGLGDDVDTVLLGYLAAEPERLYLAPDGAALREMYERIAADMPCPGGATWGGTGLTTTAGADRRD